MIIVYRIDAKWLLAQDFFSAAITTLPLFLQNRINAYQQPADRATRLAGKLLLKVLLADMGLDAAAALQTLQYAPGGKPFIPNAPYSFNIAHSGMMVFVAFLSNGAVGVDAEELKQIIPADYQDYLTQEEWQQIIKASAPEKSFYYYWTRKEAILKAAGAGIHHSLQRLDTIQDTVMLEDQHWQLITVNEVPGYMIHLATNILDANYQLVDRPLF